MVGKEGLHEMLELLGGAFFVTVKTPVNYTQKGTLYRARAHVMLWSVEGRKENKMQQASFDLHHTASYRPSLPSRVPFFTSKTSPNHDEKGHPPNLCSQNLRRGQRDATAKPRKPF